MNVLPNEPAPPLRVETLDAATFDLIESSPANFTMIVFYRGLHCPVCRSYLRTLDRIAGDYEDLGVDVIAISMDDEDRADEAFDEWGIDNIRVGYGLNEDTARQWGLFISTGLGDDEPDVFSEPGLFLVAADGRLYYAAVNSMPFGRPDLEEFVASIDWLIENDYPSRGRNLRDVA